MTLHEVGMETAQNCTYITEECWALQTYISYYLPWPSSTGHVNTAETEKVKNNGVGSRAWKEYGIVAMDHGHEQLETSRDSHHQQTSSGLPIGVFLWLVNLTSILSTNSLVN